MKSALRTTHLHCLHLAALAASIVAWGTASAQLAVDRSEIFIKPAIASERVGLINVNNASNKTVQAIIKLEDWDRSPEGSNRWYPAGSVKGSCGKLLTVFPMSLNIDAGATQSIRLLVNDSISMLPRECWSAVMIEAVAPPAKQGGMNYVIRTAVKVYVEPAGLRSSGEITDMLVRSHKFATDSLEVWFQNTGEKHYIAKGSVEFRRADNSVAAKVELDDFYLLPGAKQHTLAAIPKLPAGEYVAIAMVDHGGDDIAAMQMEYVVPAIAATEKRAP